MKKGQATLLESTLRAESPGLARILILEKIENSFHLVSVVSLTSVKMLQSKSVSKMTSGSGNNKKKVLIPAKRNMSYPHSAPLPC